MSASYAAVYSLGVLAAVQAGLVTDWISLIGSSGHCSYLLLTCRHHGDAFHRQEQLFSTMHCAAGTPASCRPVAYVCCLRRNPASCNIACLRSPATMHPSQRCVVCLLGWWRVSAGWFDFVSRVSSELTRNTHTACKMITAPSMHSKQVSSRTRPLQAKLGLHASL
jgi:hypothetical protein